MLARQYSRKKAPPHEALFWRFGRQFAVRRGDWKRVCWKNDTGEKFTMALCNLKADSGEKSDVAPANPDVVRTLQAAWSDWNKGNARPLFGDKIELEESRTAPWVK